MRIGKRQYMFLITSVIWACAAFAQSVPQAMNYQGRLNDGNGQPITGTRKLEFNVYTAATGGSVLWGPQTLDNVEFSSAGEFNVILGPQDSAPTPRDLSTAFTGSGAFLGIKVGAAGGTVGAEISPRQQVLSAPYSFRAGKADHAASADNAPPVKANFAQFQWPENNQQHDVPGAVVSITPGGRAVEIFLSNGGYIFTGTREQGSPISVSIVRTQDNATIANWSNIGIATPSGGFFGVVFPQSIVRAHDFTPLPGANTYKLRIGKVGGQAPDGPGSITAGTIVAMTR